MRMGVSVMAQPFSAACLDLRTSGTTPPPPSPPGLPPCVLDIFCYLDNMLARVVRHSSLQCQSVIMLLGQQTSWKARFHWSSYMLLPPTPPSSSFCLPVCPLPSVCTLTSSAFTDQLSAWSFQLPPAPQPLFTCHSM